MENRKDIGEIFKEKLANLDKSPSDALWNLIEKDLDKKKKKRIYFWLIPSLLITSLVASLLYFEQEKNNQNQEKQSSTEQLKKEKAIQNKKVISAEKKNKPNNSVTLSKSSLNNTINNNETVKSRTRTEKLISKTQKTIVYNDKYEEYEVVKKYKIVVKKNSNITPQNKINSKISSANQTKNSIVKKSKIQKKTIKKRKNKPVLSSSIKEKSIDKIIDLNEKDKKSESINIIENIKSENISDTINKIKKTALKTDKKAKQKKQSELDSLKSEETKEFIYYGSIFYGPTIFGSLNKSSMINSSFNSISKSHPITSYYGFYLKSKYKRMGISLGISKINLKMANELNSNQLITNYTNIDLNNSNSVITINNYINSSSKTELIQKTSYYEMSLAFYYSLLKEEKKFGVDAFSGFSMLTLYENKLYLISNEKPNMEIGSIKDISKANLSLNIGLALNYKLFDGIYADFNPYLKYYLSPFNNTYGSKPYSLSIQSGLTYKF